MDNQKQYRRSLWIPPMLWRKVVTAAGRETARTGKSVTSSEIVRRSLEAYLTKQERKP